MSVCLFAFCFVRLHVYTSEFLLIFCHAWFYLFVGLFVGDVGIMVADCSDEASLSTMCSAARIILNCVGPVGENFLSFTLFWLVHDSQIMSSLVEISENTWLSLAKGHWHENISYNWRWFKLQPGELLQRGFTLVLFHSTGFMGNQ